MPMNATHPDLTWTDVKVSRLRALWDEGRRTAAIGVELGLTKNAVVGKAHRLGLVARPSPIKSGEGFKPARVARPRPPKLAEILPLATGAASPRAAPAVANDVLQAPRIEAERRAPAGVDAACCWPIGHPGTSAFRFCEQARLPAKPYCETHAARAYVAPASPRAVGRLP